MLKYLLLILNFFATLYLSYEYLNLNFPTDISTWTLSCTNDFFSCTSTHFSKFSNIYGYPIALFGVAFTLLSLIYSNHIVKLKVLFLIHLLLSLALIIISIITTGGICPFCLAYHIVTLIIYIKYIFKKPIKQPYSINPFISYLILALLLILSFDYIKNQRKVKISQIRNYVKEEILSSPRIGRPKEESPYLLAETNTTFSKAPLRVTIFADLQCPACAKVHEDFIILSQKFKGQITIQFFPYPLDSDCNPSLAGVNIHPYSCLASKIALCSEDQFPEIINFLYKNQINFSHAFFNKTIDKYNLFNCQKSFAINDFLKRSIELGNSLNLSSTPSLIINGILLEGAKHRLIYQILLEELLAKK